MFSSGHNLSQNQHTNATFELNPLLLYMYLHETGELLMSNTTYIFVKE